MDSHESPIEEPPAEEALRERAVKRIKEKREFRSHAAWFILVNAALWVIWALPPDSANTDDIWPAWVTGIWGVFLLAHAWRVYGGHDGEISEGEIQEEMNKLRK
jgi:2TM domain